MGGSRPGQLQRLLESSRLQGLIGDGLLRGGARGLPPQLRIRQGHGPPSACAARRLSGSELAILKQQQLKDLGTCRKLFASFCSCRSILDWCFTLLIPASSMCDGSDKQFFVMMHMSNITWRVSQLKQQFTLTIQGHSTTNLHFSLTAVLRTLQSNSLFELKKRYA